MSAWGLGRAKTFFDDRGGSTLPSQPTGLNPGASTGRSERAWTAQGRGQKAHTSSHDRCHKRPDADDVHHAREVIGQHVQRHFGGDARPRCTAGVG